MADPRACAICGCTEANACTDELRGPCHWVGDRLCSHCAQPDPRRAVAIIAASQLAGVVDELLRFAREGDQETFEPFALEPAEHAADALRTILRIENMPGGFKPGLAPPLTDENRDQLIGALDRYLEAWA